MKALRARAVSFGFLADIVGTWIASGFFLVLDPALVKMTPEEQVMLLSQSPTAFAIGAFMTYLGGFVAATLAPGEELANSFAVGILSTIWAFLSVLDSPDTIPFWIQALGLVVTIPLAIGGGLTRRALRTGARR